MILKNLKVINKFLYWHILSKKKFMQNTEKNLKDNTFASRQLYQYNLE